MTKHNLNPNLEWENLNKELLKEKKPSWDTAPGLAQTLGVPTYGPYMGIWCWFSGPNPGLVEYIERRPVGK